MRKWQDLAAPDDPGSWYDVSGMWPTRRGTYETADISSGSNVTAVAGLSNLAYAFAYDFTGPKEYVVTLGGAVTVYSWDGSSLTSRLSIVSAPNSHRGMIGMARYGDVALLALSDVTLAKKVYAATSFTSAFAEIAGAPASCDILVVQSNAALAFSHNDNAWYASDVGDYTNWATGEAASGHIYTPGGNVTAAVAYGSDVFVFKPGSIHRMTYVGGTVKWNVQRVWAGLGVPDRNQLTPGLSSFISTQDWAIATQHGIVFYGGGGRVYLFDGASEPRCLNPLTTINVETLQGVFVYNPQEDVLCIAPSGGSSATGTAKDAGASTTHASPYYYYSFPMDAWGSGVGSASEIVTGNGDSDTSGVLRGDYYNSSASSAKPVYWTSPSSAGSVLKRCAAIAPAAGVTCYLQSSRYGQPDGKTTFKRLIPILRRRTDLGTDSATLTFELFAERENTSTSSSSSISESTYAHRFDLLSGPATDRFGRFKVAWADLDVEVDDFLVKSKFVLDGD